MDQLTFDLDAAKHLAPYFDTETLDELIKNVALDDPHAVVGLAPFLSQEALVSIVERISAAGKMEISWLKKLMPFLKKDSSDRLVEHLEPEEIKDLAKIAPFLRKRTMVHLLEKLEDENIRFQTMVKVALFPGSEHLEELLEGMEVKDIDKIQKIAPFLGSETLKKWIRSGLENSKRQKYEGGSDSVDD